MEPQRVGRQPAATYELFDQDDDYGKRSTTRSDLTHEWLMQDRYSEGVQREVDGLFAAVAFLDESEPLGEEREGHQVFATSDTMMVRQRLLVQ